MNIQNEDEFEKLKKAIASDEGQQIINYIKSESKQFDFKNLKSEGTFEEIGRQFKVYQEINNFFNDLFSKFENWLNN